jgi:predicted ArsR family transcriptional regulator
LDVVTAVQLHGAANVGAAVESLLAALLDILSDLIGADMARALVEHDGSRWAAATERRQ